MRNDLTEKWIDRNIDDDQNVEGPADAYYTL